MKHEIPLPFQLDALENLRIYDTVLLTGSFLVARDQAHKRLHALLLAKEELPIQLRGETIYYMGPSATPEGRPIGSCGPTTSARMDEFTPVLMEAGIVATIGKGPRNNAVVHAIARKKGLYLIAFGGCGALYANRVVCQEPVAFEDLGPEAIIRLWVEDFPVIVGIDSCGNSVFT